MMSPVAMPAVPLNDSHFQELLEQLRAAPTAPGESFMVPCSLRFRQILPHIRFATASAVLLVLANKVQEHLVTLISSQIF